MKRIDYFLTSLILTLTLVGFCSALLIAEFNSSRYIPASLPRFIELSVESPIKGEVTFLGEKTTWDLTQYEEEISYVKKASVILPRGGRIMGNSLYIIYKQLKAAFRELGG